MTALLLCMILWAMPEDWPQWRGPNRDGVWPETGVTKDLSKVKVKWRQKISSGYSSPTVADNRVFITDKIKGFERIHCFDARSGKKIWEHVYECVYKKIGYGCGPRAAVTLEDNRAYALGAMGHLFCLQAKDGVVLWKKDLNKEYGINMPIWGIAASPLIEGDLVIVQACAKNDACFVAFDKLTGKEKWKALEGNGSYSSPIVIEHLKKRVLVCWTGNQVAGLDPKTGKPYWRYPFTPPRTVINIPDPVRHKEFLFFSSFYMGSLLLKLDSKKQGVHEVWRRKGKNERATDALHCCMSTPLLEGDHIYGVDSYGELRCLDLKTGDRVWESLKAVPKARWSNIHMVKNKKNVWMFNERGDLILCRLSPKGYEEISRTHLIQPTEKQLKQRGGVCWSHPAYANKHVFVRNDEELLCADLSHSP